MNIIGHLGTYDYIQKYTYVLKTDRQTDRQSISENPYPNKIWILWFQGIENAPPVVQKCVNTIKSFYDEEEVILLNDENLFDYVQMPEYIVDKWHRGIISNTHFSDIVRLYLLSQYGGMWIDSTVLLFDKVPEHIRNADLFCFQCQPTGHTFIANWFIVSKPNNPIILITKEFLLEYWRKENSLASYCLFHLFFTMAVDSSPETKAMWKAVPYYDDINCKLLQYELLDTFSEVRLEQITQMSVIQKLSYKFTEEEFAREGTFYDLLIKKKL